MSVAKTKATGTWECRYYVRTAEGKLKLTVKKGFRTKSEAQRYEITHKHEASADKALTVGAVFELMSRASRANDETTSTRRNRLLKYAPSIMSKPIGSVTKADMIDWRAELDDTDLATRTKNDAIGYMKQIFAYAYNVYDIPDVTRILKKFPLEMEDLKEKKIITPDEFFRILSFEEKEEVRIFLRLLYFSGCRKGEARALSPDDFDGKGIYIGKATRRGADKVKSTKTRTTRYVPLDEETCRQLKTLMGKNGRFLFGDYEPINLNTIADHFRKDCEKAGITDITFHNLRHSHVSLLFANHVPIPEISKRIGHSSPKVTMSTYAHIFNADQSASLNVLNSIKG